jgi:hypothetical protein
VAPYGKKVALMESSGAAREMGWKGDLVLLSQLGLAASEREGSARSSREASASMVEDAGCLSANKGPVRPTLFSGIARLEGFLAELKDSWACVSQQRARSSMLSMSI